MDISKVQNPKNSNEVTRAFFDNILLGSRYINSTVPDISYTLFGKKFVSPIMTSAFSHLNPWHEKGMVEMAKAAKTLNICNWVGMGDENEFDEIMSTGASCIKIIKPYKDRSMIFNRIEHACKRGALAVGIDIDHSFNYRGQNDVVNGLEMCPITSDELCQFVKFSTVPFVIKGVMGVDDAYQCAEAGVKGIVISHHHGRIPSAVPPLMVLSSIKKCVGIPEIIVDCGIESGIDAFKALALGATAVSVGRIVLDPLKEKGQQGVVDYVNKMNDELRYAMACTGFKNVESIDNRDLWNASLEKNYYTGDL